MYADVTGPKPSAGKRLVNSRQRQFQSAPPAGLASITPRSVRDEVDQLDALLQDLMCEVSRGRPDASLNASGICHLQSQVSLGPRPDLRYQPQTSGYISEARIQRQKQPIKLYRVDHWAQKEDSPPRSLCLQRIQLRSPTLNNSPNSNYYLNACRANNAMHGNWRYNSLRRRIPVVTEADEVRMNPADFWLPYHLAGGLTLDDRRLTSWRGSAIKDTLNADPGFGGGFHSECLRCNGAITMPACPMPNGSFAPGMRMDDPPLVPYSRAAVGDTTPAQSEHSLVSAVKSTAPRGMALPKETEDQGSSAVESDIIPVPVIHPASHRWEESITENDRPNRQYEARATQRETSNNSVLQSLADTCDTVELASMENHQQGNHVVENVPGGSQNVIDGHRKIDANVEAGLAQMAPFIFPQSQLSCSSANVACNSPVNSSVVTYYPAFVKDNLRLWYKPKISRENAIRILRNMPNGSFIIRDSIGFPGAYGLALKVARPPPHVLIKPGDDISSELVRHYLVEPTVEGVRLKGCANEPTYINLSALVYHHSLEAIALPCKLLIPNANVDACGKSVVHGQEQSTDPPKISVTGDLSSSTAKMSGKCLLERGAACHVIYLLTTEMSASSNESAVEVCMRAIDELYRSCKQQRDFNIQPTIVHFRVSAKGITLTDVNKRIFFRRHYSVESVLCASVDHEKTRYFTTHRFDDIKVLDNPRCFGFLTKTAMKQHPFNLECHLFIEYDPRQPAGAVVNFINKVMLGK